ncbi:SH3 and multiple ankyrin repeat domains protein 3 [Frankliniella fusca]|uniref:SH3 and multiple ankyrin repeat domains protein 3 n=1 Tax=Frankliniella fusca TaxID=407009 RepID=A0AAE1LB69_9NEOP|nr:SH3 and multiple ankyrin repeat domains protein 3 [Frankliniella fusca]
MSDDGGGTGGGGGNPMAPAGVAGPNQTAPEDGYLLIQVHVPELNVQKCLQFPRDQLVWDVKQQCLATLPKELKESFNYGLFSPPVNGKAGKFLDEERRLGDYPFNGPIGYLELKYKRRVYKMLNLDEKQLKALHTRSNLRRLLDYVTHGQVEKITKMCSKGLDPNFHCQETGETPLTLAVGIKKPGKVLMALVNGGAILDYRTREGSTAMHRAVEKSSLEALTTLLELGASPNYKDGKGLTPLYLTVTHRTDPMLAQTLLHDRAVIGAQDLQGWQEVHQACRNGLVVHLEHLLSYGADMNAKNASGNTPLHVCAVNNQESSARMLLFRGCQRDALNYANQTPYQVAVIAGNLELAEVIQKFQSDQVVPYREPPQYNPRRRRYSDIYGTSLVTSPSTTSNLDAVLLPPSPSLSNRSVPPFSYASSSMSETSSGSSTQPSVGEDSVSIITDKSVDETSDSSGVGTATSDLSNSVSLPGTTVICLENYSSNLPGHLSIMQGDILEVTGATDCGLLEGTLRGRGSGLFPAHCVQEVMLRPGSANGSVTGSAGSTTTLCRSTVRVLGRREANNKHFATAPRQKKQLAAEPRTVVLHRSRKGFGFVLRGAKATSPLMELQPSERCPGLQYLDDVDIGGVADLAGLCKGDYLVAINGEDVSAASHEHVVSLIRRSGDLVQMTVVSASASHIATVPNSKSSMTFSCSGGSGTGTAPLTPPTRQYATLPRKLSNNSTLGRSPAPLPPRRDPRTTLSVGRARARSMVAGLEGGGEREEGLDNSTGRSSSAESIHCASGANSNTGSIAGGLNMSHAMQGNGSQPRTASIRARPTSSRITATELEELFQRQQGSGGSALMSSYFQCGMSGSTSSSQPASPARTPRVYNSVAEMKRMKGKANTRVRFSIAGISGISELHRDFHSTPDLAGRLPNGSIDHRVPKGHRSEDDVTTIINGRPPLPPPNHPPPPPPTQIVKVDLKDSNGLSKGDYINTNALMSDSNESYMSSFKPSSNAKLYASPDEIKAVRKSQSLRSPPTTPRPTLPHQMSDQGPTLVTTISIGSGACTNTTTNCNVDDANQYAQPFRCRRSLSTKERREAKSRLMANLAAANASQAGGPPIPDPDYSLSEGEGSEEDPQEVEGANFKGPTTNNEGSGNSESSSGSGSLSHSLSVDEILKVRTRLKTSKSYPNDFLLNQNGVKDVNEGTIEDGDNSSSGVSSDQDIPIGPSSLEQKQPKHSIKFQQKPAQVITSSMTLPSQRHQQQQRAAYHSQGILTRNAVSLAQLPPPLEAEADEPAAEGVFVPPPPQFGAAGAPTPTEEVFAPPPQFCDNRLVTRVRIVATTPKGIASLGGERLNSK